MRKTTKKAAVAAFIAVCLTAGMTLPVPFGGEIGTVVYADGETTPEASTVTEVSNEAQLRVAVFSGATGTVKLMNDITIAESEEDKAQIKAEIVDLLKEKYEYSDATASTQANYYLTKCLTITNAVDLTLDLQNHTLSRQLSGADGSGMVIDIQGDGNVTIKNGVITGGYNTANGGGIQATGDLTLDGVNIVDNMASGSGGGVYVFDGNLTVANSVIQNNTAAGSFGGGIYVTRVNKSQSADICNLKFTGGNVIERNEVHGSGGGVYFYGYSFDTSESTRLDVMNNTAYSMGGGLYIHTFYSSDMTFDAKYSITGNTASNPGKTSGSGGGLYTAGNVNATIAGAVIKGNTAAKDGGGVYGGYTVTLKGGSITGNTAANGGGVYVTTGVVMPQGQTTRITGNTNGTIANNLYLKTGAKITQNGAPITVDEKIIGVTMQTPGVFTGSYQYGTKNSYIIFTSDDPDYIVYGYEMDKGQGGSAGELALIPASDPVESGIKKVKFVWKQDGTCDFYTSKDGQDYGEPSPANVEGSTATMTVEGKTYTSVKPGSAPSVVTDADVKVTYDNDNGSYTMTLSIVCGVPKNGDDCLVGVGFYVKDLSGTDTHVLKKTGFASWSAKYSVKFGVSGQGVVVKPFALVKPADKFNDDSVETQEALIDTWGTFYPAS